MIDVYLEELADGLICMDPVQFPEGVSIGSWRGDYNQIGIGYGYDGLEVYDSVDLGYMLKDAICNTFEGFKGGEFVMYEDATVHISDYGSSDRSSYFRWLTPILCQALEAAE